MNISEIMDCIHEVEQKIPVHEWSYKGMDIWPILRAKLYFDLFNKHNFASESTNTSARPKVLFDITKQVVKSLPAFAKAIYKFITSKKIDAIFLADPSYILWNGKYYQRFVDPEIEYLLDAGKTAITITSTQAHYKPLHSPTLELFIPILTVKIFSKICTRTIKDIAKTQNLKSLNIHLESLGLEAISQKKLTNIILKYHLISQLYQVILQKFSPAAAFVVSYYDNENMAFVHACRKLAIPIVDIQHGAINNFHACYGGMKNVPNNGYNTLPTVFACWDKKSANCINSWANLSRGKHTAVVHGNKFMHKVLSQKNRFEHKFRSMQNKFAPEYNIILTLQTNYEITTFLQKMLELSPTNYFWWIRLHPMLNEQESKRIKATLDSLHDLQYDTDSATSNTLYEVLPLMDVHITLNSSVVIESSQLGIPSIVCEETGYKYYQAEFESGSAFPAETPEIALQLVAKSRKKTRSTEHITTDCLYSSLNII